MLINFIRSVEKINKSDGSRKEFHIWKYLLAIKIAQNVRFLEPCDFTFLELSDS